MNNEIKKLEPSAVDSVNGLIERYDKNVTDIVYFFEQSQVIDVLKALVGLTEKSSIIEYARQCAKFQVVDIHDDESCVRAKNVMDDLLKQKKEVEAIRERIKDPINVIGKSIQKIFVENTTNLIDRQVSEIKNKLAAYTVKIRQEAQVRELQRKKEVSDKMREWIKSINEDMAQAELEYIRVDDLSKDPTISDDERTVLAIQAQTLLAFLDQGRQDKEMAKETVTVASIPTGKATFISDAGKIKTETKWVVDWVKSDLHIFTYHACKEYTDGTIFPENKRAANILKEEKVRVAIMEAIDKVLKTVEPDKDGRILWLEGIVLKQITFIKR